MERKDVSRRAQRLELFALSQSARHSVKREDAPMKRTLAFSLFLEKQEADFHAILAKLKAKPE